MCYAARYLSLILIAIVCVGPVVAAEKADDFLIGGPLAGIQLPSVGDPEVELYPDAVERFRMNVGGMDFHYGMFDKQTQLKNWTVPNIPGSEGLALEQFLGKRKKVGKTRETIGLVDVVRCKIKAPVFKLDLGELGHGLYAIRVVAAAETAKMKSPYVPLYVALRVNDGLRGETNQYRVCCAATDVLPDCRNLLSCTRAATL
ncbi:MAG: hypothetical protein K8U03_16905 [Planctomycetia bacterium]|nr:hypothetical protein [Planctomycetia bacterium]